MAYTRVFVGGGLSKGNATATPVRKATTKKTQESTCLDAGAGKRREDSIDSTVTLTNTLRKGGNRSI